MKIAIIGGGWIGCHLAHKLIKNHQVVLFEQDELFKSTSYNNQNRLHLGFHYARNYKTRQMCQNTFNRFINEYGFLVNNVKNNIYCVPLKKSLIDYPTYIEIFKNKFKQEVNVSELVNIEGAVTTNEKHINFELAHKFFNDHLKNIVVKEKITEFKLSQLSKEYDLVVNVTNNALNKIDDSFHELTLSLLYQKIKPTSFDALTLVDGKFFSIYPYKDNIFTLTDVEHTPLKEDNWDLEHKKQLFETKVISYFPNFLNYFKYEGYFISSKSKPYDESDNRYPVITQENNIINCYTGKIQGIYIIEDYINEIINR